MQQIESAFSLQLWLGYLGKALQALLLAIPVAALFEIGGALLRRWALKRLGPLFARDQERDPIDRARRRRALRDTTVASLRWAGNVVALTVILTLWHVDPVAVALLVLCGVAVAWSVLRDAVAGYGLLLEDCFGPGDQVVFNGQVSGVVEECGLLRQRLVDQEGHTCWIASNEIRTVVNLSRKARRGAPEEG